LCAFVGSIIYIEMFYLLDHGGLVIHSTSWGYEFCVQELYAMWCGRTWFKTLTAYGFRPLVRVCHITRRYNEEISDR
jgi:hypothetical protein